MTVASFHLYSRHGYVNHVHTSNPDGAGAVYIAVTHQGGAQYPDQTVLEVMRRTKEGALQEVHVFDEAEMMALLGVRPNDIGAGETGKFGYCGVTVLPDGALYIAFAVSVPDATKPPQYKRQAWGDLLLPGVAAPASDLAYVARTLQTDIEALQGRLVAIERALGTLGEVSDLTNVLARLNALETKNAALGAALVEAGEAVG